MFFGPSAARPRPAFSGNARCPSWTRTSRHPISTRTGSVASSRSVWTWFSRKKAHRRWRLPMTVVEAFAPAKVNLALHVTGRRDDGYHLLDSLVMFADVGDRITVERATGTKLTITGPMSDGVPATDDNLVLRAARLMGSTPRFTLKRSCPMPRASGAALRMLRPPCARWPG